jgi:hypothetical protein
LVTGDWHCGNRPATYRLHHVGASTGGNPARASTELPSCGAPTARLLPQLRSLLERKKQQESVVRHDAPDGEFRTHQERHFGKHFSMN